MEEIVPQLYEVMSLISRSRSLPLREHLNSRPLAHPISCSIRC
jgi:hypothetical protein